MSYFRAIPQGEVPTRPIWLPFLETLASQVDGCDVNALVADATRWANAMPSIAKLVEAEVVAVGFIDDLCLPAFAAMPEEPWRHDSTAALLECVTRLAETVRPQRELAVCLPGPARICRSLGLPVERTALDGIKAGLVKLLEMVCERRPDIVMLNEVIDGEVPLVTGDYRRMANTLKNVSEYFGIPLGLRISGYADGAAAIQNLRGLKLDHLMLGKPGINANVAVAAAEGQGWQSLGIPLVGEASDAVLPQKGSACYWCSLEQETDLEQARKTGQALAKA